jgi:anaerobic selenocysteine-containing dehydrogenase
MRTVNGTCHHDCPDSCGWVVTVDDQPTGPVAIKLRGNPEHPFSKGELCPKVNRFLDRVYSDDRILTPLRRVGPKGSGQFEPMSWDDALALIGERWTDAIARHGSETLMPLWDAGNQSWLAMHANERFLNRIGATRMIDNVCGQAAGVGWAATYGTGEGADPQEIQHSDCVVLWGTNTRLTNRHLWPFIETARSNGAPVICVDPLRTMTAQESNLFVRPLPGTDIALLLGLIHIWDRDQRIDRAYVEAHAEGADELLASAKPWNPQLVAETCDLDPALVEELAAHIGRSRAAHFRTLIGAEHREQGTQFFRLLTALPVLLGSWANRGGGASRSTGVYTRAATVDISMPMLRGGKEPQSLSMNHMGRWLTDTTLSHVPVTALLVWNFNPLVTLPNAELIRVGLAREDLFTVVHEQFLTDTARYADVILPATTQIEQSDVVQSWGSLHINWNEAAIPPVGESVSNSELFRRLSAAMGFTDPELFLSDEELLTLGLPGTADRAIGITPAALRLAGTLRLRVDDDFRPYAHGGFGTPSGKAQLASDAMEQSGLGRVVHYVPAQEGPHSELAKQYPLSLMTPKVHTRFINGSYAHLPNHGGREDGPWIELSAADAARRDISTGDEVEVYNGRSSLRLRARIGDYVRDGLVAVPFGWHGAAHPDGRTANALTNDSLTTFGGGVAYSDTMVEVRRYTDSASVS